ALDDLGLLVLEELDTLGQRIEQRGLLDRVAHDPHPGLGLDPQHLGDRGLGAHGVILVALRSRMVRPARRPLASNLVTGRPSKRGSQAPENEKPSARSSTSRIWSA